MTTKQHSNGVAAKHVTIKGKRMVMLEENEFKRLLVEADLWEPLMPPLGADGTFPAEVVRISLAIDIIRDRRRLGLTRAELARRAGIRLTSLERAEEGRVDPGRGVIEKIDRALKAAETKAAKTC